MRNTIALEFKGTMGSLRCGRRVNFLYNVGDVMGDGVEVFTTITLKIKNLTCYYGGDEGIRTLETVPRLHP